MGITIEHGDIFDNKYPIIAHQCNTKSLYSKGLAEKIFNRYPYANTYTTRFTGIISRKGGTISIHENEKTIINMYAQIYPGGASQISIDDNYEKRLLYFNMCLYEINKLGINTFAIPYGIGCGLGKGSWKDYMGIIMEFWSNHDSTNIIIVKHITRDLFELENN